MVWVLLAVVISVAVSAFAVVVVVLLSRRRTVRRLDTFPCRVRVTSEEDGRDASWSTGLRYGTWVHDVLAVRYGIGLLRTDLLAVECARGSVRPMEVADPTHLGRRIEGLTFVLDDGTTIDVAVPADARELLPGPFMLAGIDSARPGARSRPGDSGA